MIKRLRGVSLLIKCFLDKYEDPSLHYKTFPVGIRAEAKGAPGSRLGTADERYLEIQLSSFFCVIVTSDL